MRLKVDFKLFFEPSKIEKAADRKSNRVLFRTGGFGKKVMSRSIKPKPKKKQYTPVPGTPPRYQVKPGLKTTHFGVDKKKKTVAIGSLRYAGGRSWSKYFNGRRFRQRSIDNKTIPQLITEGGDVLQQTQWERDGQITEKRIEYDSFPYDDLAMVPTVKFMQNIMESEPFK